MAAGAEVDARDDRGLTPLVKAAGSGLDPSAAAEVLLAAGADPAVVGHQGESALRRAAAAGSLDLARRLVAAGALPAGAQDSHGAVVLTAAAVAGHLEVVRWLVAEVGIPAWVVNPLSQRTAADHARAAGHHAVADLLERSG